MHFRGVFEILKTLQFGFDRHLLVWEYDLVTSRISKREKCVLYDFFHCNIYNISLIKKVQTTIPNNCHCFIILIKVLKIPENTN